MNGENICFALTVAASVCNNFDFRQLLADQSGHLFPDIQSIRCKTSEWQRNMEGAEREGMFTLPSTMLNVFEIVADDVC